MFSHIKLDLSLFNLSSLVMTTVFVPLSAFFRFICSSPFNVFTTGSFSEHFGNPFSVLTAWEAVGPVLTYGFKHCGYIPVCLSPVFLAFCLHGEDQVDEEDHSLHHFPIMLHVMNRTP